LSAAVRKSVAECRKFDANTLLRAGRPAQFEVRGFDPSLTLDPKRNRFWDSLTLTGDGDFTGCRYRTLIFLWMTIEALSSNSEVPAPSTWAMIILGCAGIGFIAYLHLAKPA